MADKPKHVTDNSCTEIVLTETNAVATTIQRGAAILAEQHSFPLFPLITQEWRHIFPHINAMLTTPKERNTKFHNILL
jgi:hypothetical protein